MCPVNTVRQPMTIIKLEPGEPDIRSELTHVQISVQRSFRPLLVEQTSWLALTSFILIA